MRSARTLEKLNLRVGDWVEVRSAQEIFVTLDENGCFEQLPFMPEMLKFCGQKYRVFKRANKVIDMVKKTGLRKMTGTVILESIRCEGYAHGGCQAGCYLLWKEIWLRRVSGDSPTKIKSISAAKGTTGENMTGTGCNDIILSNFARHVEPESSDYKYYRCQATQLFNASNYLSWWDPRQYVIDLWSGNVSLWEFVRVAFIGLFNCVQELRGGFTYPHLEPSAGEKTPSLELNLAPGEVVRVKSKKEIQSTLDKNSRNRGLWFDVEMLRYCGSCFRVLRRVERTIDEKTGRLVVLRNPCIILEGVTAKGTFHRFNPQNEYIFWREIWLERVSS